MSLAPNFDLLVTNGQAELVARQIMGRDLRGELFASRFDELGIVQAPPAVCEENFAPLMNSIFGRQSVLPERTWTTTQIPQAIQSHSEVEWLSHMMSQLLPDQGTNSRALIFKGLRLMDNPKLVPDITLGNIPDIVEETISRGWLDVQEFDMRRK